jgi:glycosyltransferase involved in cell wall biosynthesis
MNLTIDISAAVNVPAGLGRYARSLVEAILPYQQPQIFYNVIPGRTQPVEIFNHLPTRTIKMGYKPWRMAVWAGQIMHLPFNHLVPNTSIFHATEHLLMPLRGVKTVMTVHDLIFRLFPEHHKRLNYWFLNSAMPMFVKRADHIIAISEATKLDLIAHYRTSPEKITVIYEAVSPQFQPQSTESVEAVRRRYHLPETYALVVGTIEPRKNYSRLLQAIHQLRKDYPDLYLVVVGSKGWLYEDFFQHIEALNATDWVIFPGYVPDEALPAVYAGATVMVMASVYEGFGLPLLEAMSCCVPAGRCSALFQSIERAIHD